MRTPSLKIGLTALVLGLAINGALHQLLVAPFRDQTSPVPADITLHTRPASAFDVTARLFMPADPATVAQAAKQMREGTIPVRPSGYDTPQFNTPINDMWQGDSLPYIRFNLHAFTPLWDLRRDYLDRGDQRDLAQGRALVRSWLNADHATGNDAFFTEDDVAIAWRATALAALVDAAAQGGDGDPAFRRQAATLLWRSAAMLASPGRYKRFHNHGIFQSVGLFIAATHLPDGPVTRSWQRLALKRLSAQLPALFSDGGMFLENSPNYHVSVTGALLGLQHYAATLGMPLDDALTAIIRKADAATGNLILPHRAVPPLGDTPRGRSLPGGWPAPATDRVAVYPAAGYAMAGDRWRIMLAAACASGTHKQRDDLSILLTGPGGPLLTDPGMLFTWQPDEKTNAPYRHSRAWQAHNTVSLKGDQRFSRSCAITAHGTDGTRLAITARSERHRGAVHLRRLYFDETAGMLLVLDRVNRGGDWWQTFQFPYTVGVARADSGIRIYPGDGSAVTLATSATDTTLAVGQIDPWRGWLADPATGQLIAAPAFVVNAPKPKAAVATVLLFNHPARTRATVMVTHNGDGATIATDGGEVSLHFSGNRVVSRVLSPGLPPRVSSLALTANGAGAATVPVPFSPATLQRIFWVNVAGWLGLIALAAGVARWRVRRAWLLLAAATLLDLGALWEIAARF